MTYDAVFDMKGGAGVEQDAIDTRAEAFDVEALEKEVVR